MQRRASATRAASSIHWEALPALHAGSGYRLIESDCVELLDRLPEASVDLVFADPPYYLSNGGTTCQSGRRVSVDKGGWDASHGLGVDHAFQRRWLKACRRVLKPSGTIWVSGTQHVIFSLGFAMQELGFHILNTVTWYKPNASPNLACRFFTHSTELVIWAAPARTKPLAHTFNYPMMKAQNGGKQMRDLWALTDDGEGTVWTLPAPGQSEKREGRHPTQKPFALLDRIVTASSKPGDLVLDPFNGSGTTGVVALARGRRYLGIDIEPAYLDLTARRIAALSPESSRDADAAPAPRRTKLAHV
jgi:site-specific DNA-methyltransferase (adenine-specific)